MNDIRWWMPKRKKLSTVTHRKRSRLHGPARNRNNDVTHTIAILMTASYRLTSLNHCTSSYMLLNIFACEPYWAWPPTLGIELVMRLLFKPVLGAMMAFCWFLMNWGIVDDWNKLKGVIVGRLNARGFIIAWIYSAQLFKLLYLWCWFTFPPLLHTIISPNLPKLSECHKY